MVLHRAAKLLINKLQDKLGRAKRAKWNNRRRAEGSGERSGSKWPLIKHKHIFWEHTIRNPNLAKICCAISFEFKTWSALSLSHSLPLSLSHSSEIESNKHVQQIGLPQVSRTLCCLEQSGRWRSSRRKKFLGRRKSFSVWFLVSHVLLF